MRLNQSTKMRHPSGRCRLSKRRDASLYSGGVPQVGGSFRLDIGGGARGAECHARGRAIGIVSQMAGAMVLSRAVSHVAHDHADELTEVNRALPGS